MGLLDAYTPYDANSVFPVPNISADLGWAGATLAPSSYLDNQTPLDLSDLGTIPSFTSILPDTGSGQMFYNPSSGSSDTGMGTQDWINAIGGLATIGLKTYASVEDINRGNLAPYAGVPVVRPPQYVAAPTDEPNADDGVMGALSEFSLASLVDFSTPWPYIAGAAILGGLAIFATPKKKRS